MVPDLLRHEMPMGGYEAQSDFRKRSGHHKSGRDSDLKRRIEKANRKAEKKTPVSSSSAFETEADTPNVRRSRVQQCLGESDMTPDIYDRTPASLVSQDRDCDLGEQRFS